MADFVNELSCDAHNKILSLENRQRFSELAVDCLHHISLYKERIQVLLNAHKGILSPVLISPRQFIQIFIRGYLVILQLRNRACD